MNDASKITNDEWKTLPVETIIGRRPLSMTLKQIELKSTSNTVHFVLNDKDSKDG